MCDWGRTHIAVERKHTEWRDHRTNLNDCGTKRVYFRFPLTSGAETRPPLPAGPHHCTKHLMVWSICSARAHTCTYAQSAYVRCAAEMGCGR